MLVFVTSLRHPQNSHSYSRVESLLEKTLASVCAQTCDDFRVIVVCHRIPKIRFDARFVEFVVVDFPPPSDLGRPQTGIQAVRLDKGSKLLAGILEARKLNPTYVMIFDADDRVSNRIAEYAHANPSENGWYFYEGYTYSDQGSLIKKKTNFHLRCGTSHIFRFEALEIGKPEIDTKDQQQILKYFGERFTKHIIGCHMTIKQYFHSLDAPLKPLPFPGAVWVLNTGENHSGSGRINFGARVTKSLEDEFSIGAGEGSRYHWIRENVAGLMTRIKSVLQRDGRQRMSLPSD